MSKSLPYLAFQSRRNSSIRPSSLAVSSFLIAGSMRFSSGLARYPMNPSKLPLLTAF